MSHLPSLGGLNLASIGAPKKRARNNAPQSPAGLQLHSDEYFLVEGPSGDSTQKAYIYRIGDTGKRIQPLLIQYLNASGNPQLTAAFMCTRFVTNAPNSWLLIPCLAQGQVPVLFVMEKQDAGEHRFVFRLLRVKADDLLSVYFPSRQAPHLQIDDKRGLNFSTLPLYARGPFQDAGRSYESDLMPFDTVDCNDPQGFGEKNARLKEMYGISYKEPRPFPSATSDAEEYGDGRSLRNMWVEEPCLFQAGNLDGACAYLLYTLHHSWNASTEPPAQMRAFENDPCEQVTRSYCQEMRTAQVALERNGGTIYTPGSYPTHHAFVKLYSLHNTMPRW